MRNFIFLSIFFFSAWTQQAQAENPTLSREFITYHGENIPICIPDTSHKGKEKLPARLVTAKEAGVDEDRYLIIRNQFPVAARNTPVCAVKASEVMYLQNVSGEYYPAYVEACDNLILEAEWVVSVAPPSPQPVVSEDKTPDISKYQKYLEISGKINNKDINIPDLSRNRIAEAILGGLATGVGFGVGGGIVCGILGCGGNTTIDSSGSNIPVQNADQSPVPTGPVQIFGRPLTGGS